MPSWPLLFAIATLVPLLPLLWFLNRFERFRTRGKIFFAGFAQAAASLFVWVSYLTVSQYHSVYSATAWVVLLGALGVLLVIGSPRRSSSSSCSGTASSRAASAPVAPEEARAAGRWSRCTCPICNEPPEMVRETLDRARRARLPESRSAGDRQQHAATPACGSPSPICVRSSAPASSSIHLDKVEGFKAGALNYVLG